MLTTKTVGAQASLHLPTEEIRPGTVVALGITVERGATNFYPWHIVEHIRLSG